MSDVRKILQGSLFQNKSDLFVAIGVIVVVAMLIIPLPTFILDFFMSLNLVLSLIIILIVLYTRRALDFSIFPTILLVTTVFGLALNVSSTRLILSRGAEFNGKIVRAFGNFVVGTTGTEGLVIGVIIFVILVAVQFIVITKGATRVAEVAARFTLDGLPGKQMAIEAEYNSGAITEEEATRRKQDLQKEADFYGAMDGASKFISGNVIVGIVITLVNVIGGMIIGITLHGEPLNVAVDTYISLTIGDGLVSQFPLLLISTSTGLIVTRAVSDGSFGRDATEQFSRQGRVYWIAGIFLFLMGFLPGFPWYILMPLAAVLCFVGFRLSRRQMAREEEEKRVEAAAEAQQAPTEISPVAPLDPISLELGYGLIPLVDKEQGAELLDRITRIRRETALELGLVVPRIRIIDNMRLEPSEYCFKIKGIEVGRGALKIGHYLAINPGSVSEDISGEKTTDPAFGLPALWIAEEQKDKAEQAGYTVVDSPSIIATHLTELIKKHASEIIGRQEVQSMLDTLKHDYPAVVDEVMKAISIGEIQKILQGLLKEQVSIRNLVVILETISDYAGISKEIGFLVEKSRQALGRQICLQYAGDEKKLRVITIDPTLEQKIIDSRMETTSGVIAALEPEMQSAWINALTNTLKSVQDEWEYPIILCSEAARQLVKSSTGREVPDLVVLSVPEIASGIHVESLGEIQIKEEEDMQYFTEQAPTHREAIERIKEKFGQQARILTHRRVKLGGFLGMFQKEGVEVTGFIAQQPGSKNSINVEEEKRKILDNLKGDSKMLETLLEEVKSIKENITSVPKNGDNLHHSLQKVRSILIKNDFSPSYIETILTRCKKVFSLEELEEYDSVESKVLGWIEESIPIYQAEEIETKPRVCILVGPTGVGKTTTIAKLAAIYGIGTKDEKPVNVRMFTADNYRIGAKKQLETYGDIMGIPVAGIETYQDFKKKLSIFGDADLILVDTTGKSPRNHKGLAEMQEILDACGSQAEIHLTVSATTKDSDILEIMRHFEPFNYSSIILTKLDETVHIGNLISVFSEKKKPISFLAFGQGVPQDIEKATAEQLMKYLEGFGVPIQEMELTQPTHAE